MIEYKPNPIDYPNSTFVFNYKECKDKYLEYIYLNDNEFKKVIKDVLHLSVMICWIKGLSSSILLNDLGLIHLLVHQISIPDESLTKGEFILMREQFKELCKLS